MPALSHTNLLELPFARSGMAKYAKMWKMHMPEGAIRGKMRADGITDEQIDAFLVDIWSVAHCGSPPQKCTGHKLEGRTSHGA